MNELALFAGAGGGILGGHLLGWRTVVAVERDAYAAQVLAQRQNDGCLRPFPIWSDVTTFDGRPWCGLVDVVSGGFPCQDISAAGAGAGIDGERSGLWHHQARIIRQVRPRFVYVENSPMLTTRGLGRVLGDLAALGFDAEWGVLGAHHAGAPHERERIWILAYAHGVDREEMRRPAQGENGHFSESFGRGRRIADHFDWPREPDVERVADGIPYRLERNRALGNAQVPRVAAAAWGVLTA
ncbi:DNA cytosine methyltransferase [Massilia timonae]|uniref:DNA cytosine methyltransferase n=1 Tax=Massilia timonae TaxID=47229 RepID=UPI002356E525|nr:DNA cytosine methyltransferase [Massilia timonae]